VRTSVGLRFALLAPSDTGTKALVNSTVATIVNVFAGTNYALFFSPIASTENLLLSRKSKSKNPVAPPAFIRREARYMSVRIVRP
jgi:hypothetical protein